MSVCYCIRYHESLTIPVKTLHRMMGRVIYAVSPEK
jgi:hypothetical protein